MCSSRSITGLTITSVSGLAHQVADLVGGDGPVLVLHPRQLDDPPVPVMAASERWT